MDAIPKVKRKKAGKKKVSPMAFAKAYVESGENASEAFKKTRGKHGDLSPSYLAQGGTYMLNKPEVQDAIALVKTELENLALGAVKKVGDLVHSENEVVAGQNARFIIEHVKGKPMSQQINTNINLYEAVNSLVLDVDAPEAEIVDAELSA